MVLICSGLPKPTHETENRGIFQMKLILRESENWVKKMNNQMKLWGEEMKEQK